MGLFECELWAVTSKLCLNNFIQCLYITELSEEQRQQWLKCCHYEVLKRDNNDVLLCNSRPVELMVMTNSV